METYFDKETGKQKIYCQHFKTPYSAVGPDGILKPVEVLNFCQDIASSHSYELGLSALHMAEFKKMWVVHRYSIEIERLLLWDEAFSIETWRSPLKKLYEMRAFDFRDSNGNIFVKGICAWVLVDMKTKKPSRLDRLLPEEHLASGNLIDFHFDESQVPELDFESYTFKVLQDDMDFNRHANNASYLKWALECLDPAILFPCKIKNIDINYIKDIKVYNEVEVRSFKLFENNKHKYIQVINDKEKQNTLSIVKIDLKE